MSLFQKTVITKYLNTQNKESISLKWESYKSHFLNPKVQEEIKSLKEEQYQGEFLEDLFVKILGYTKPASSSETPYNLTTEYKNVKDSKKADGAIIIDTKVKAVIELKGTNTTDLVKIEAQAFGYKNNQPECVYVITSNFEKLRFYIDNAIEHLEFNLFALTQEEFSLLYLCLGYENIANDVAKKIKEESLSEEDVITKKLYKDYSVFKRELYQSLVQLNPDYEPLELFKKSQKLLDRFLFLLFGEDRNLLPPNSVKLILSQWNQLRELDEYTPLYDRFKKYFGYLNTGYKGKQYDVFAYNGGLFKPDEILDSITIDDDLLYTHTLKLSEYDFASEVDVNILGHIFENSLNELDEIKAQLEGTEIDKSKTKRKKDGVFYTPKYITKYIVENTVGKLCDEKKIALEIIEEDYFTDKKRQKKTIKGLIDKLEDYRNWLLQLTICDPACGSGAFLNQALDFLIEEHRYIDELQAKLFGDAIVLSDVEKSILENNLFGVDLNEESVEIAKLSLWLRTAQPNRKLNDLNNNIKCGNSLIEDVTIAGDKAFNWHNEFPQVFEKGGFDVVIGNPPYVVYIKSNFGKELLDHIINKYVYSEYNPNTYALFTELALTKLLKLDGFLGFIIPNTWLDGQFFSKMRSGVYSKQILEIVNLKNSAFSEIVETVIIHIRNQNNKNKEFKLTDDIISDSFVVSEKDNFNKYFTGNNPFSITSDIIIQKLDSVSERLGKHVLIYRGLETKNNKLWLSESKKEDTYIPILLGSDVNKYKLNYTGTYVNFIQKEMKSNANINMYNQPKILMRRTGSSIIATLDEENFMALKNLYLLIPSEKISIYSLLAQLNSSLFAYYHNSKSGGENKAFAQFKGTYISDFPIQFSSELDFKSMIYERIDKEKVTSEQIQKFQRAMQRKFELEDLPKKLQDWYKLTYPEFIKELAKKKVKLSLSQEAEWEDYFIEESKKVLELKSQINATDKTIDKMVYELYGLTEEEIEIVENQG
jgi:type I restriction-modification system DNA methylase subunit